MDNLTLALQPIEDLHANRTSHFEALVRMRDDHDPKAHVAMLENAEREGWIGDIDMRVAEMAAELLDRRPELHIAVNVSPQSVETVGSDLLDRFSELLDMSERLVVEITETAPFKDLEQICRFTTQLQAWGFRVALDDYGNGAGYVTDEVVQAVRPNFLKLDKSVIEEGLRSRQSMARALLLGAQTGAEIIAEFVDSNAKVEFLNLVGIRYAQGNYFGSARKLQSAINTVATA